MSELIHPAPVPAAAPTPADLLMVAVQQNVDIDRLQRLMDMHERWSEREAVKAFHAAMTDFKSADIEIVKNKLVEFKNGRGEMTTYRHAELYDITSVVGAAMSKRGLSYRWEIQQDTGSITVTCIVTHVQGHSESVRMTAPPDGSGGKNQIQQVASTVSYLERYTLLAITGLATKGDDDDGRGGAVSIDVSKWLAAIAKAGTKDQLQAIRDAAQRDLTKPETDLVYPALVARMRELEPA